MILTMWFRKKEKEKKFHQIHSATVAKYDFYVIKKNHTSKEIALLQRGFCQILLSGGGRGIEWIQ